MKRITKLLAILLTVTLMGCGGEILIVGIGTSLVVGHKLAQENYSEAIPLLEEIVSKSPDDTKSRGKLGFCYLKTNQTDKAIAEFTTVLEEEPEDPFATLYLGVAYVNNEQYARSLELWNGYKNEEQPIVEKEVKRLLTLAKMAKGQKDAKIALSQEEKLKAVTLDKNSIAVGYYQDLSPDGSLRAFLKALTAMVTTDLTKIGQFKVVERENLQALLNEMKLADSGIINVSTAPRFGKLLGAANMVTGNLSIGSIEAVTSIASSDGSVKGSSSVKVKKEQFFAIPSAIVKSVAKSMGVSLSPAQIAAIEAPHTESYEAFVSYGAALDALDIGDWATAQKMFSKALIADPGFGLARDARDSSPDGASSASITSVKDISPKTIANAVAEGIERAEEEQEAADAAAGSGSGGEDSSGGPGGGGQSEF